MLVAKYHDSNCENIEIRVSIDKAIKSSLELRSNKELIDNFIDSINATTDVQRDWQKFIKAEQKKDLDALIEDEKLNPEETKKFLIYAFRDGELKTTGTGIDKLMPPVSRFGGGRCAKKTAIIEKLLAFFTKYFGLGIPDFKA